MVSNGIRVGLTPVFLETEQAVETIAILPTRKDYNLRSTSRSFPHSSLSVTTDYPSHGTGPRPKGANRKEGKGGLQEENRIEEEGNNEEEDKVEGDNEEENEEEGNNEEENEEEGNEEERNRGEGEGIGGDEGVVEQHGVEEEAGNILRTAWDSFCHCG